MEFLFDGFNKQLPSIILCSWQRFSFVIFSFYYDFPVNGIHFLIYFMNIYLSGFSSRPLVTKKFFHLPLDDVGYDPIL
ncbi:hypothetical protein AOX87_12665 [Salmonella enterica subsp. enterica serovar Schwarzengrund]|nr:hypothetical protein PT80_02235 [Salmonella enterica subsp. enterica serovar Schwarzengrund]KTL96221.1 hypothetical protein IN15_00370 [Salmonella enterica]KNI12521.1 hypothetical protein AEU02_12255 [Salmonella enterica subsp. enterica serovar Schwarzengrund]KNI73044.1 hypothetical protein AEU22_07705 [Salmonella enterica subsp. enterica serovar Schwarzengrund]KNK83908.1 hypothetical protein AEU51_04840 [Salmonella enterica subsp. enterica serovar Schwarzengrund]